MRVNTVLEGKVARHIIDLYADLSKKYPNRLVGVFAIGAVNYGFEDLKTIYDTNAIAVITPTFEDVASTKPMESSSYTYGTDRVHCVDIRIFSERLQQGQPHYLEALYSKEYYLNPKYELNFTKYFLDFKKDYTELNQKNILYMLKKQALTILSKKNLTKMDLFEGRRILDLMNKLRAGKTFEESLYIADSPLKLLLTHIIEKTKKEDTLYLLKKAADVSKAIDRIPVVEKSKLTNQDLYGACLGVQEIMRTSMLLNLDIKDPNTNLETIKKALAKREWEAFLKLINRYKESPIVSIKKIERDTNISKSVYTAMLSKLRELGIIKTVSHGVAGTEIQFLQSDILIEMEMEGIISA